jgi:transglutaminase-like putative cysteine protease
MIRFQFSTQLDYEVLQRTDFVFNIRAAQTTHQNVVAEVLRTYPRVPYFEYPDAVFENRGIRLSADPGMLQVFYEATIEVQHHLEAPGEIQETRVADLPAHILQYLRPSRYVQSDRLLAAAFREFGHLPRGYARVQAICDWVRNRTKFVPGSGNLGTTALDTFTDQCGVCRDFSHLMIGFCRALNIPARFVTGLDYGADPALGPNDFHAYVEVFLGRRWYVFDPTAISPPLGLPRIATGRDAADAAFATMFGRVNYSVPRVTIGVVLDPVRGYEPVTVTDQAVSTADDTWMPQLFLPLDMAATVAPPKAASGTPRANKSVLSA